jgi:hypothetical protein
MATIIEIAALWNKVDIEDIVDKSIKDNEQHLIDAQVDQMRHGLASDGGMIGEYKNESYKKLKQEMGSLAPYGMVDLRLTTDFQKAIKLEYSKDFLLPTSTDKKSDMLTGRYTEKIWGLIQERLNIVTKEFIKPTLFKIFRGQVKLENIGVYS